MPTRRSEPTAALPRYTLSRRGLFLAWGDRTSIVATSRSVWTWQTSSKTRKRAPPCCKWRRYGCAWPRGTTPRANSIKVASESLSDRFPSRASPKPAPSPPRCGGAARSSPVAPNGDTLARSAGIALRVPCRSNRPAERPFHCIPGNADGTYCRASCSGDGVAQNKPRRVAGAGP